MDTYAIDTRALPKGPTLRATFSFEPLEGRRLLSAAPAGSDDDGYRDEAEDAAVAINDSPEAATVSSAKSANAQSEHQPASGGESGSEDDQTSGDATRTRSAASNSNSTATSEADDNAETEASAPSTSSPETGSDAPPPTIPKEDGPDVPAPKVPHTTDDSKGTSNQTSDRSALVTTGTSNENGDASSEPSDETTPPTATSPSASVKSPTGVFLQPSADPATNTLTDSTKTIDLPLAAQPAQGVGIHPVVVSSTAIPAIKSLVVTATAQPLFSELPVAIRAAEFGLVKMMSNQLDAVENALAVPPSAGANVLQSTQRIARQFARLGNPMLLMNDSLAIFADESLMSAATPVAVKVRCARLITATVLGLDAAILIYARRLSSRRGHKWKIRISPVNHSDDAHNV